MRDAPELPRPEAATPELVRFAGLLEAPTGDLARLRAAFDALQHLGVVRFRLDFDGGRFTVMPDETPLDGAGFDATRQELLLDALQRVVTAAADPARAESTLRCSLVFEHEVAETLFVPRHGELRPVSRMRPRHPHDSAPPPDPAAIGLLGSASLGRRLAVVACLALAAGLVVWQSGILARAFAEQAQDLPTSTGPFHGILELAIEPTFDAYDVVLRRGPDYPATLEQLAALEQQAGDLVRRAAVRIVGDGGVAWVALVGEDGKPLVSAPVALRALLTDPEGAARVALPAHAEARFVRLALDGE